MNLPALIKNIDFLFIDGDHSIAGCRFDFEKYQADLYVWAGLLPFMIITQTGQELGPTWVIDNLVKHDKNYVFYKSFDTLCVFKKISLI